MRILLQGGTEGERAVIGRALVAAGCVLAEGDMARDVVLTVNDVRPALARGGLTLDPERGVVTSGGRSVRLSRTEVAMLAMLLRADRPLGRADLLAGVWGYRFDPGTNIVAVLVSRLRAKIGADAIRLVGDGYLIAPARPTSANASSTTVISADQERLSATGS